MQSIRVFALFSFFAILISFPANAGSLSERERAFVEQFGACMGAAEILRLLDGDENAIVIQVDQAKLELLDRLDHEQTRELLIQIADLRLKIAEFPKELEADAARSGKSVAYIRGAMSGIFANEAMSRGCNAIAVPAWFGGTR